MRHPPPPGWHRPEDDAMPRYLPTACANGEERCKGIQGSHLAWPRREDRLARLPAAGTKVDRGDVPQPDLAVERAGPDRPARQPGDGVVGGGPDELAVVISHLFRVATLGANPDLEQTAFPRRPRWVEWVSPLCPLGGNRVRRGLRTIACRSEWDIDLASIGTREAACTVIIWGTRTKRQGRGFVILPCPFCGEERPHFVAESKTKFTLYFVPTFTTSTKALLICTECERQREVDGPAAAQHLAAAVPPEILVDQLRRAHAPVWNGSAQSAGPDKPGGQVHSLAVGLIVSALGVAIVDGHVDRSEAAALEAALRSVGRSTQSSPVKRAASLAHDRFGDLMDWIASPATDPLPVMLATAGAAARSLPEPDRARYLGQIAWLSQTIAAASRGQGASAISDAQFDAIDAGFLAMGYSPADAAVALEYCDAHGG